MLQPDSKNPYIGVQIPEYDFLVLRDEFVTLKTLSPDRKFPPEVHGGLRRLLEIFDKSEIKESVQVDSISRSETEKFKTIPIRDFKKLTGMIDGITQYDEVTRNKHVFSSLTKINNLLAKYKNVDVEDLYSKNKQLQGLIEQLTTRQNEVNSLAKSVLDDINEQSRSAEAHISRLVQKQSNSLSIQSKELQSNLISQLEKISSDAKIEIQEEASKLRRELTEELTSYLETSLETKQNEINESTKHKADALLENVRKEVSRLSGKVNDQVEEFCILNDALRRTLNFVAKDALADSSIDQAEKEKATADSLRGWGVAWLIVCIGLFLLTFDYDKLIDDKGVPQYTLILLRSFFLIVGIAPGFYLLRESARHRTDERRYRQKGIQLATIDGYFAEFEESERNDVKKDLSKHYFHGADHFVDSSSVDNVQSKYDKIFDKVVSSKKFS
ncbi:coiled-coil domain-containing protein [Vibrio parahaemolyticus]